VISGRDELEADTFQQRQGPSLLLPVRHGEPEETVGALMDKCSRHVIPPAVLARLANRKGHDLCTGFGRPAWSSAHLPMARGSALLVSLEVPVRP